MMAKKPHISPEDPHEPISTKFGTTGRLADLIAHDNFFGKWLRGFESVRGWILPFSYLQMVTVNTVLALPHCLWSYVINTVIIIMFPKKSAVNYSTGRSFCRSNNKFIWSLVKTSVTHLQCCCNESVSHKMICSAETPFYDINS